MPIDAVVFDFGGVVITPITNQLNRLARRARTDMLTMLEVVMGPRHHSSDHPWHRAERGEIPTAEIQGLIGAYAGAAGIQLVGDEIDDILTGQGFTLNDDVVSRITSLSDEGVRVALLTNSFVEARHIIEAQMDFSVFTAVIDSSLVGCRKPEPAIYEVTAQQLGVAHDAIAYLDDFADNLVPAATLGWTTIHVVDPAEALAELTTVLSR